MQSRALGHDTPHNCTAVGSYTTNGAGSLTLAERWNGISWRIQSTPNPGNVQNSLNGVSCSSPRHCTAVGFYISAMSSGSLVERWNGSSWKIQASPDGALRGVSCTSQRACTAVGSTANDTVAERWNGISWEIQPTPTPTGALATSLSGVSCPRRRDCTAVGSYVESSGTVVTLGERWNGAGWAIEITPNPTTPLGSSLSGVSCPRRRGCFAVGGYAQPSIFNLANLTLAEGFTSGS